MSDVNIGCGFAAERSHDAARRGGWVVGLALALLMFAASSVTIGKNWAAGSRAAWDQDKYHLMAIRQFAHDWPHPDLMNYRSATTPGYHLALALADLAGASDTRTLRLIASLFTSGLLVLFGVSLTRRAGGWQGLALALPLACSLYVFSSSAWLLPDNAAWWGVLGLMVLGLSWRPGIGWYLSAGAIMLALVFVRQVHLWGAGVVWLSAFLGDERIRHPSSRGLRVLQAALVTVPAIVAVWMFARLWGGLVPPLFQSGAFDPVTGKTQAPASGGNLATPAFMLTLTAMFGVFFLGYFRAGVRRVLEGDAAALRAVAAGAIVGILLALPPTSFNESAGRYSGFWSIAGRLPCVMDRSLFISAGSIAGGVMLALVWLSLPRRDAIIVLGSLAGFALAAAANFYAWQRYLEPMVLLSLGLTSARATNVLDLSPRRGPGLECLWRARAAGPVLLAMALAGITVMSLRK